MDVEEIRTEEAEQKPEEELDWKTLMDRLLNLTYERPDIIFIILAILLEHLKEKEIFTEEEIEEIIREGVRKWKG